MAKLVDVFRVMTSNFIKSSLYRAPDSFSCQGYVLKPMSPADAWRSVSLFSDVFPGESYGFFRASFLLFIGHRFSFCAVTEEGQFIGFEVFRLAKRDIVDGTIHESFVGVDSRYSGRGVATNLRKFAIKSLKDNGFKGISSRIALSNSASLRSAVNLGFKSVDNYINHEGQEETYLVLRFDDAI